MTELRNLVQLGVMGCNDRTLCLAQLFVLGCNNINLYLIQMDVLGYNFILSADRSNGMW